MPEVECVFLKGDTEERGGVEKKRQELGSGRELSMYWREKEGEEEVLWMQVRIALSR